MAPHEAKHLADGRGTPRSGPVLNPSPIVPIQYRQHFGVNGRGQWTSHSASPLAPPDQTRVDDCIQWTLSRIPG